MPPRPRRPAKLVQARSHLLLSLHLAPHGLCQTTGEVDLPATMRRTRAAVSPAEYASTTFANPLPSALERATDLVPELKRPCALAASRTAPRLQHDFACAHGADEELTSARQAAPSVAANGPASIPSCQPRPLTRGPSTAQASPRAGPQVWPRAMARASGHRISEGPRPTCTAVAARSPGPQQAPQPRRRRDMPAAASLRPSAQPGPNPESDGLTEQKDGTRDGKRNRPDRMDHTADRSTLPRSAGGARCCVRMQPPPRAR